MVCWLLNTNTILTIKELGIKNQITRVIKRKLHQSYCWCFLIFGLYLFRFQMMCDYKLILTAYDENQNLESLRP